MENRKQLLIKIGLFITLLFVNCYFIFAQIGFRAMPSVNIPVDKEYFNTGFGAAVSLDWGFPLNNKWALGFSLTGGLADFSVDHSDSFTVFEGGGSAFGQWRLSDRFSLRADVNGGVYQFGWEDVSDVKTFAGGSLSGQYHLTPFMSLFADIGLRVYLDSFTEPLNNLRSGVGIQLNLSELMRPQSRLRGERTEQYRIFPVTFSWYEDNPLAMMRITNEEPNTITNIQLSFLLERYMNQPSVFANINRLEAGETLEVPVKAMFNESMLDLTETLIASAQVIADYRSLGISKTSSFPMQMPVFHRNAMTWDDDRRAAAFVSPRDPVAVYFARYTSSAVASVQRRNVPENVRMAAALFEALRLYGINYTLFAASTFAEKTEDAAYIDNMTYPYETLFYRSGACDSLSILYSAMLEALGIESAFITIPGHIYVAFDIGDEEWRKGHADIIEYAGKRWQPVEVTVPDRGFAEACRIGGRQWRTGGEDAVIYPMHENWLVYPPVSVNAAGDNMPSMPAADTIARALEAELSKFR